jgi:hypothetical protein
MTMDLDLSGEALKKDLGAAASRMGVRITTKAEQHAMPSARVSTTRTHHLALAKVTPVRARFVKQGWAELAKKLFVKEIEVGEKSFDDAVYIATDTEDAVRTLLTAARVRAALVALAAKDCIIDIGSEELTITHPDAYGDPDDELAEALALAAHL